MSLTDFMTKVGKEFGKDVVRRYGDKPLEGVDVIPTGSLALDKALGIGGWPRGRVTEILGNAGSGKTTLALHAIAEAQKLGYNVLFVDAEHALDPFYAQSIGVNINDMHIVQPQNGEEALDVAKMAIQMEAFELIVVDSVAALVPLRELEGDMGDSHIGLQARMLHKFCRSMSGSIKNHGVCMMWINQYRASMNTMGFGPQKIAAAGSALEYTTSIKADVARIKSITDKDGMVQAHRTRVKMLKNKVAKPYRIAEFDIVFGMGINQVGELIDIATELGLVKKGGSWYTYGEYKIQGRDRFMNDLLTVPDMRGLLEDDIKREIESGLHTDGDESSLPDEGAEA